MGGVQVQESEVGGVHLHGEDWEGGARGRMRGSLYFSRPSQDYYTAVELSVFRGSILQTREKLGRKGQL